MAAPKKNDDDKSYFNLKLKTTEDIINTVNRVANMLINKKIDEKMANALGNLAKINLSAIRLNQLEDEVQKLKDLLNIDEFKDL